MNKEIAIENERLPKVWLAKVMQDGYGAKSVYNVQDPKNEEFLMRLRLSEGLSRSYATDLLEYDPWHKLNNLVYTGDISLTNDHFSLTSSGFLRYNSILKYLYNKLT
jgi:coproporphyrinogen III oxidase-like Fe-S oxidoreductase